MNVLIIAAHPDDEVLGVGGTVFKHIAEGDNVFLLLVTQGEAKKTEIMNATKGYKNVYSVGYENPPVLDTIPLKELNRIIKNIIAKVKPEIIYIPFEGDLHKDHQITHYSSLVAARPMTSVKKILAYETTETQWGSTFTPNVYVDISKYLNKKLKVFKQYLSQIKEFPHPRSEEAIIAKAKVRGSEACLGAAEAFKLIREIKC